MQQKQKFILNGSTRKQILVTMVWMKHGTSLHRRDARLLSYRVDILSSQMIKQNSCCHANI
uniref:Uncharacterized protein n=1 Tax=Triticum urartu TaxID=4572 RepID=A0A8R7TWX5_TRIUA